MNGKSKCKILKDIRRQIAQDNGIEFVTSECKYQGDCSGTCPKCEAEVRYLEQELAKRQAAGKAIAVAGIAAALVIGSSGCGIDSVYTSVTTAGDIELPASTSQTDPSQTDPTLAPGEIGELAGEPEPIYPTDPSDPTVPTYTVTAGVPAPPLTGDIAVDYNEDENIFDLPGSLIAP